VTVELDDFTLAYAATALWSSLDANDEPLDIHGIDRLADSTRRAMREDCDGFRELVREAGHEVLLNAWSGRAAHDFWLTRNRHGVGFWDGPYPEPGRQALTDIAHSFASADLYVGNDGLIYQAGDENR
jgi:hypothetical protein